MPANILVAGMARSYKFQLRFIGLRYPQYPWLIRLSLQGIVYRLFDENPKYNL